MITRGIESLVRRDWARVRAAKNEYWGERIGRLGAAEGFRIADELRRQVLLQDPTWPGPAERDADLQRSSRPSEIVSAVGHPDSKAPGCSGVTQPRPWPTAHRPSP